VGQKRLQRMSHAQNVIHKVFRGGIEVELERGF
jgi:hypothetical protein